MNREKAIDLLDNLIGMVEDNQESDYDTALKMGIQALSQEPTDTWSIKDVADTFKKHGLIREQEPKWIPVSERLPENTYPVNITWVNHDPEPYYAIIKDKPFTATGHYCNGKWWWYSVTCQDYLDEYGHSDVDAMDEAVEVTAWMPLPAPFEPQERSDKE